jgi:hypothetical protein
VSRAGSSASLLPQYPASPSRLGVRRKPVTHSAVIRQTIKCPECGGTVRFRELTNVEIWPISDSQPTKISGEPCVRRCPHNDPPPLGGPKGNLMPVCGTSTDCPGSLIWRKSGSSLPAPRNRSTQHLVPGHDAARPIWSASRSGLTLPSACRCDRPSPCRSSMWAAARSCGSNPDRSMLESR